MKQGYLILLLLFPACQAPTTSRPQLLPEEIRAEEEVQRQMVEDVKAQGGTKKKWKNRGDMRKQFERVGERIEEAGAQICREMGLPEQGRSCYYFFDIRQSDELNAYADGKNIIVNAGMIRFLEGDDELAAVLSHELAHNLMGHVEASRQNRIVGGIVGLVFDGIAASQGIDTQGGFTRTGIDAGHLSYSPSFEEEADYIGLYIMARARYDITRVPHIWRRMSLENPQGIYNAVDHPSNAQRFVLLQKTIDEIRYKRSQRIPLLPAIKQELTNSM